MLSSCCRLALSLVPHLASSLLVLNSRGAKAGMRTHRGVDGRMLFTYAQLSPREKEGSEEVGKDDVESHEEAETARDGGGEEAKVHRGK